MQVDDLAQRERGRMGENYNDIHARRTKSLF